VLSLDAASEGNSLKFVGYELLQKYDVVAKFKVRKLVSPYMLLPRVCPSVSHKPVKKNSSTVELVDFI